MNKDWNYALMWDTIRRALEESVIQGLEGTALNVLNVMIMLEELEERRRKERKKTAMEEKHRIREMQTMFDVKIVPYNTQAEEAEECE